MLHDSTNSYLHMYAESEGTILASEMFLFVVQAILTSHV